MELLHRSSNLEIRYDAKHQILYCNWIGIQTEEALKASGEKILELLISKGCSKVLNDNTNVVGHWYHSVEWTSSNWFPRMILAGLRHFAWVCSDDVFTQLSAQRAIPPGNIVKAFNNYDEAFTWLANSSNDQP